MFGERKWWTMQGILSKKKERCYYYDRHIKVFFMLDMIGMMGKVKEMQARLKQAQDNLANVKASGESGGGMVKATVNGKKQLLGVKIDPSLLKTEDQSILQDLIVAAVNK